MLYCVLGVYFQLQFGEIQEAEFRLLRQWYPHVEANRILYL
jgi:hypothetical protein